MIFKGKAHITISRPTFSSGKERIQIAIADHESRTARVEVEMALDDFARALTGLGHVDVEAEWMGTDKLGTRGENKVEVLAGIGYRSTGEEIAAKAAEFEVDGWSANLDHSEKKGSINMHRLSEKGYAVTFFRNVPLTPPAAPGPATGGTT